PLSTTQISTLSLHDALPIFSHRSIKWLVSDVVNASTMVPTGIGDREFPSHQTIEEVPSLLPVDDASEGSVLARQADTGVLHDGQDRKSTRLNSSHVAISYAV